MPTIEPTLVPMPFDLADERPQTHADAVAVAANTADLMEQLGGRIDYDDRDLSQAEALISMTDKQWSPKASVSSAEAKAISVLIKRFDFQAFEDALKARHFVTNKLVLLADCGDPKIELRALELLGKHSDIGLFTERSEITVHHSTSETLEKSIRERVKRLLNSNVNDIEDVPIDDLDAHLGVQ